MLFFNPVILLTTFFNVVFWSFIVLVAAVQGGREIKFEYFVDSLASPMKLIWCIVWVCYFQITFHRQVMMDLLINLIYVNKCFLKLKFCPNNQIDFWSILNILLCCCHNQIWISTEVLRNNSILPKLWKTIIYWRSFVNEDQVRSCWFKLVKYCYYQRLPTKLYKIKEFIIHYLITQDVMIQNKTYLWWYLVEEV